MAKAKDFLAELDDLEPTPLVPQESTTTTPSLQLFTKLERSVIDLTMEGLSIDTVALRLALPKSTVEAIVTRKDVQEHLKLLSDSLNQLELLRLKSLYARALDEKISEAEENGTSITKKDTLDVLKAYQELLAAERKSKEPEKEQNIYVQILQQVTGD